MHKGQNWRHYLSFRVLALAVAGLLALALITLGCALGYVRGAPLLWPVITGLLALAGLLPAAWLWVLRPYRRAERLLNLYLEGHTLHDTSDGADCALSHAAGQMHDQMRELLNPAQLFNLNKRQAQYLALQNQINPHFLYNTLESIRSEAMLAGLDGVAEMTEALATFFRYTITKVENLVSVEEELSNCETYFAIQQYRFGERLQLDIQCDPLDREEIYRYRLPKLTMQPILENSIIHGTEQKIGAGELAIHLERTGKRLLIRISDNGIGMDEETLTALNGRLGRGSVSIAQEQTGQGGLALVNVDNRIRLLFGDEYGLHVFSVPGVGTDVEITLPLIASDRDVKNREALQ